MEFEQLKLFLPKYLSTTSEQNIFQNLKDFPENIDKRMYAQFFLDEEIIYQGDGLEGLLIVNFPDRTINTANSMILSNTCDMDLNNIRIYPSSICYAPIINLQKFAQKLYEKNLASSEKIGQFILSLKKQRISQIFFLPQYGKLTKDSFIYFNKINCCDSNSINRSEIKDQRIFSLSNYGLYLFLFKLSIHFSRIREEIDRG